MIKIDRPSLSDPAGIELLQRAGAARQVLIDTFRRKEKPSVDESLYKAYKKYLLEAFHHKCAYCETVISVNQPVDVEHYRPKNRVTDNKFKPIQVTYDDWGTVGHMGYFWLAYDWDNLLPSCIDCNRFRLHDDEIGGKGDRFPVANFRACLPGEEKKEAPLLVNPTLQDPNLHFEFLEDGTMRGLTDEGYETIVLLGLNLREHLVRARAAAFAASRRALREFLDEVGRNNSTIVDNIRDEVNSIWEGRVGYSAYGRKAIKGILHQYARSGLPIPMPLPGPQK
ncbi:MAG: hypothetical protein E5X67_06100 [Mesorhizobium sp.]|uniref:HNH endonuclease n=1 Tax=Mesorhizobium sp. TaxID=1871066 RepID=UPI0011F91E87|nr:hypothetical protein [Mesorhizobium sp.]TIP29610.1 MAG: hypothetical protein E5X67_06100 [Mesorhizobium sp.]